MKILLLIIFLCSSIQAKAANDDLIIQTKVDATSLSWLIDKTRLIMNNAEMGDLLTGSTTVTDPIFTMDELSTDENFKRIQTLISNVFKVDVSRAVIRLRIPNIYYKVHSLRANPKKIDVRDPALELDTQVDLSGVDIGLTEGLYADFMIPNPKTKELESYFTATLSPTTIIIPNTLEPAQFQVRFQTLRDAQFSFKLKDYNLDQLPVYVENHIKDIKTEVTATHAPITADQIKVNPVIVKVNQLSRTIPFDDFKPLLQKKLPQIMGEVFRAVGKSLKTSIGPSILNSVFSQNIKSDLIVANENIYTRYATALFSQPDSTQLSLGVAGDLCTNALYQQYQMACTSHMPAFEAVRTLSTQDRQTAKDEVRDQIKSGRADVAISISEDYLNRLLKTTIDAKLWDEMLAENRLKLGPKGAFVIFDKAKQAPELYLDLIYYGEKGGIESIFINPRHPIRFPLRMSTSMTFEIREQIPYLIIKTEKLLSDSNEIIYGIPEYEMPSRLVWGLRRKIARKVIDMAAKLEGKTALDMDLPIFKGLGLENTWYESSQFGRLHLYFKL